MTQLPEAEVMRKDLERDVVGKRFKDVNVKTASLVGRHRNRPEFVKQLTGRKIEGVLRRGRHVLFDLDEGGLLVVQLGTQGALTRETASEPGERTTQLVATFTTGGAIHYRDPDNDGQVYVVDADERASELAALHPQGIDPLADTFTWPAFSDRLTAKRQTLKAALTDQSFVIGLGDLYSDEILWTAGLSPARASDTLSSQEVRRLYRSVLEVLYEAVKQRGAGEGDPGESDLSEDGEFGAHVKVFNREGQPCARCRQEVSRERIDRGVWAFTCKNCQT